MKPKSSKTVSITFQSNGITIVIRQGKEAHKWPKDRHNERLKDRHRERLLLFCLERGFEKVDRAPGLVIYRNWK